MARATADWDTNYLKLGSAPASNGSHSVIMLFRWDGTAAGLKMLWCRDDADTNRSYQFRIEADEGLGFQGVFGNTPTFTSTAGDIVSGTWHCGGFTLSADGLTVGVFLDGVKLGTDTDIAAIQDDASAIGWLGRFTTTGYDFSGDIAYFAQWRPGLADAEMLAATKSVTHPLLVNGSLEVLGDFFGDGNVPDTVGGLTFSEVGTLPVSDHPASVIYPNWSFVPSVATPVVLGRQYSGMSAINRMGS